MELLFDRLGDALRELRERSLSSSNALSSDFGVPSGTRSPAPAVPFLPTLDGGVGLMAARTERGSTVEDYGFLAHVNSTSRRRKRRNRNRDRIGLCAVTW
jgi:hypothetical protein